MLSLLTNKYTLILGLVVISYFIGWKHKGWYVDSKTKAAYERGLNEYKVQEAADAKERAEAHIREQKTNDLLKKFKTQIRNAKYSCPRMSNDFVRLYNSTN